jgi:hypothetical protein
VTPTEDELLHARGALFPSHVLLDRLRTHLYQGPGVDDLVWLWPHDLLPGCTQYLGLPVEHIDVSGPMLAHRLQDERPPPNREALAVIAQFEAERGPVTDDDLREVRRLWPDTEG